MIDGEVTVHESIAPDQLQQLVHLFAHGWWSRARTVDELTRMLLGSDVVIAMTHVANGRLLGFCRVLTDGVYTALVLDLIVEPAARNRGLGSLLVDAVLRHPKVSGVRSIELVCQPDLMPFYQRFGFTEQVGQSRLMRRTTDPMLATPRRDGSH